MGFLISINGADFKPYEAALPAQPQPRPVKEVLETASISRGTQTAGATDESFSQTLAKAIGYKQYQKSIEAEHQEIKHAYHVRDIMTSPVETVGPDTPLREIEDAFAMRNFRHLPVISQTEDSRLCGMVSDRDLLKAKAESFSHLTPVSDFMTARVVVVTPDTLVLEMALTMIQEKISALPVVKDGNGELTGIVTTTDILKSLIHRSPLELWI